MAARLRPQAAQTLRVEQAGSGWISSRRSANAQFTHASYIAFHSGVPRVGGSLPCLLHQISAWSASGNVSAFFIFSFSQDAPDAQTQWIVMLGGERSRMR